ncbi:GlsB/YeaQ/YmgE family stress response membrane protein [soil metagenome]
MIGMGIVTWIVIGIIAGILAKLLLPGRDPGGFLLTPVIGMAGAIVGGFLFRLLGGIGTTGFNPWSILVATVGAMILLAVYRLFAGRKAV